MKTLQACLDELQNLLIPTVRNELERYMPESDEYLELTTQLISYRHEEMAIRRRIIEYETLKTIDAVIWDGAVDG